MSRVDLSVLVGYLAGTVALGIWVGRKQSSDEFMSAGRRVPGWAIGLSIVGTYVSSISFLALPGKAFASDWNAFVFSLGLPPAIWIAVRYFVPFHRAAGALSAYEHLERRFGVWARMYAVVCYLLTQVARVGTILYLLALALAPLTGWSIPALVLVAGAASLVYTLYGGLQAVIWTDVVQTVVFVGGAAACLVIILVGTHGPGELFRVAAGAHKFSFGSFGADVGQSTFWVVLLYGIFINLQNFGIDQSYVQRYQAARSEREAARSVSMGGWLYLPISAAFLLIGTGLFVFYAVNPVRLPAGLAATPDAVFPRFIASELPAGVGGLVMAAVFAAAQSTISSSINGSATLILCDFYTRSVRPMAGDREKLAVLRASSLVIGVAGVAAALAMMRIRSALDAWWQLAGIFSGGMLGLFLLGRMSRAVSGAHARAGVIAGVLVILWMTFSPAWPAGVAWRSPFHPDLIIVIGTLVVLIVGLGMAGAAARPARYNPACPPLDSSRPEKPSRT